MEPSRPICCKNPDIRSFEGLRCCLSCGFALSLPKTPVEAVLSDHDIDRKRDAQYQYEPLNYELGQELRLVVLKPGKFSEDIECEILHANLFEKPRYEALSYTWADENGDDSPSRRIHCRRSRNWLRVTANCEVALRRLRRQTTERTLWIDAICIDQNNVKERNHQVKQMGAIYSSADQVLIYLGDESTSSRMVFQYLAKTIVLRRGDSVDFAYPPRDAASSPEEMKEFLSRRWFHRVWVLQEAGLARRAVVLCGEQSLDWSLFSASRLMNEGLSLYSESGVVPGALLLQTATYSEKRRLIDLLHAGRNSFSQDPRDKVYALLSLQTEGSKLEIDPDYSKPVQWLFTHVAAELIKTSRSVDILSHVRGSAHVPDLPSWVPDWTVTSNETPLQDQFSPSELELLATWNFSVYENKVQLGNHLHSRGGHVPASDLSPWVKARNIQVPSDDASNFEVFREPHLIQGAHIHPDRPQHGQNISHVLENLPTRLHLQGHRIDIVESELGTRYHECSLCKPDRKAVVSASKLSFHEIQFWSNISCGLPWDGPFRQTLLIENFGIPPAFGTKVTCPSCGQHKTDRHIAEDGTVKALRNWFCYPPSYKEYHVDNHGLLSGPNTHYRDEDLNAFIEQQKLFGQGRILFRTKNSLGLGPPSLERGDSIWVLENSKTAIILRKGDSHYKVIGECYLHGALRQKYYPCSRCGEGHLANAITTETIEIW